MEITSFDREQLLRYFRLGLTRAELDRHWLRLQRRHRERVDLFGPDHDFRATAFEYFLDHGLLRQPVVVEEDAMREAEELAFRDPLTGLFNYRYFEQQMRTELARAERHETPLCLILLDLDGFKKVNDRFGHSAGNEVLKEVSLMLRGGLREGDVVARLGGDEFAILVHQSSERAGLLIAERKRREIEERFLASTYDEAPLRVTASFGVSMMEAPRGTRPNLFDDADRALYQAKHNGRNRVFMSFAGWETFLPNSALAQ